MPTICAVSHDLNSYQARIDAVARHDAAVEEEETTLLDELIDDTGFSLADEHLMLAVVDAAHEVLDRRFTLREVLAMADGLQRATLNDAIRACAESAVAARIARAEQNHTEARAESRYAA